MVVEKRGLTGPDTRLQILDEEFKALCAGMMPEVIIDQEVTLGLENQNRGLESIDEGRGSGFGPKSGLLLRETSGLGLRSEHLDGMTRAT